MNHEHNTNVRDQAENVPVHELTRPVQTFRKGAIGASIWKRLGNGTGEYYEFSLSRAWKSQKTGDEGYSTNFYAQSANDLIDVVLQAAAWIHEQSRDAPEAKAE